VSKKTDPVSFEKALEDLETIIQELESGEVPLAELVEKYQAGSELLKVCNKRLEEAELKIQKLNIKNGQAEFEDLDSES